MKRLGVLAATLTLGAVLGLTQPAPANAQVAVCNWENFTQYGHQGFNWRWWGCNLSLMGQYQCRGEPNTDECYTSREAKGEVRAFRAWFGLP